MSCLSDRLNNLDTTIYSAPSVQGEEFAARIMPPVNIAPQSSVPACEMNIAPEREPTESYALFTNALAPGETYAAGTNIPFPTTLYNTDERSIECNSGSVSLSGGRRGKTYAVMYQVSGTFTDAQLVITEDGVAQQASAVTVTGENTASGTYIVRVPAMQEMNISVNVAQGSVETATPTAGNNLTVVRLA